MNNKRIYGGLLLADGFGDVSRQKLMALDGKNKSVARRMAAVAAFAPIASLLWALSWESFNIFLPLARYTHVG